MQSDWAVEGYWGAWADTHIADGIADIPPMDELGADGHGPTPTEQVDVLLPGLDLRGKDMF